MAHALYLAIPTLIIPAPLLANRAYLPSYARAISNLLQMGGTTAFTQISIRIPISDPAELIHQGPAGTAPLNLNGHANPNGPERSDSVDAKKHKRMSSMSTRPTSMIQGANANANTLPVLPTGMRVTSGASATSSVMSARSAVPPAFARGDPSSTWEMWDTIRRICNYHPRLSVSESGGMVISLSIPVLMVQLLICRILFRHPSALCRDGQQSPSRIFGCQLRASLPTQRATRS